MFKIEIHVEDEDLKEAIMKALEDLTQNTHYEAFDVRVTEEKTIGKP